MKSKSEMDNNEEYKCRISFAGNPRAAEDLKKWGEDFNKKIVDDGIKNWSEKTLKGLKDDKNTDRN